MPPKSVECLLCEDTVNLKQLNKHLHKHLEYFPEKCGTCSFASHSRDLLTEHLFTSGHTVGNVANNEYLNLLIRQLTADTLQAAKMGKDDFIKQKKGQPMQSPSAVSRSPSTARTTSERATPPSVSRATANRRRSPSADSNMSPPLLVDDSPAPRTRRTTTPRNTSRSSSGLIDSNATASDALLEDDSSTQRTRRTTTTPRNTSRSWSGLIDTNVRASDGLRGKPNEKTAAEALADELRTTRKIVKCAICHERVAANIESRSIHMRQQHMENVEEGSAEFDEELARRMKAGFPHEHYSPFQCVECTSAQLYNSDSGRRDHVASAHFTLHIVCPLPDCQGSWSTICDLYDHLRNQHHIPCRKGVVDLEGELLTQFKRARAEYRSNLRKKVHACFPLIPPGKRVSMEAEMNGGGGDEDEEEWNGGHSTIVSKLSELRETINKPAPSMRRPPSETSEDDDYDDDDDDDEDAGANSVANDDDVTIVPETITLDDDEDDVKEEPPAKRPSLGERVSGGTVDGVSHRRIY